MNIYPYIPIFYLVFVLVDGAGRAFSNILLNSELA